ncbi:MAG: carbonic anhydrase [Acidobacteriaceae bacterium]
MKRIIDGVLKFQAEVYPAQKALFKELSNGQRPQALFIGCSDSRVIPELFTQQGPGDLFVVRNVGNIVPPHGSPPAGVVASVEYAVAVLGVPDIIVCGHSGCGAMSAILNDAETLKALPEVSRWLNFANAAALAAERQDAKQDSQARLDVLVRANVLAQLANLLTHPVVSNAVKLKEVRLHGWVFDIATATVTTYDAEAGEFVPLSHATCVGAGSELT